MEDGRLALEPSARYWISLKWSREIPRPAGESAWLRNDSLKNLVKARGFAMAPFKTRARLTQGDTM